MNNIVIRIKLKNGDVTFIGNRQDYIYHYKNSVLIFAIEYETELQAQTELK